jgi:hypothetical protein
MEGPERVKGAAGMATHIPKLLPKLMMLVVLAACGGGGGGDTGIPPKADWGQPDPSFGMLGRASLGPARHPRRMAVAGDGSVYIVSATDLVKLDARGAPDATFGAGGRALLPFASQGFQVSAPVLDEGGNAHVLSGPGVAKFDSAGRLVLAFGVNGHAILPSPPAGGEFNYRALARDAAGNLLAVGFQPFSATHPATVGVAKLDRDGRAVATFGSAGLRLLESIARRPLDFGSFTVDREGSMFIGGERVVKLDAGGQVASDFAEAGVWAPPGCAELPWIAAIAPDAAGNLRVAGHCGMPLSANKRPMVLQLDSRGVVSASYGETGSAGPFGVGAGGGPMVVWDLLLAPDGHLYVAGLLDGDPQDGCQDMVVANIDPQGRVVPAAGGAQFVTLRGLPEAQMADLAMDGAGRLYAGGNAYSVCIVKDPTISDFDVFRMVP